MKELDQKRFEIYLKFMSATLLMISGLVWGIFGIFEYNIVSRFARFVNIPGLSRLLYVMFGLAALVFAYRFYRRDTFLPFLGKAVFPTKLIQPGYPLDYDRSVQIAAPKDAKYIVYWASRSQEEIEPGMTAKDAYGNYSNSGAIEVRPGENMVEIKFKTPVQYKVREIGGVLKPHVHYRWVKRNGMLGKVHTLEL